MNILFVCKWNRFRSKAAEAIFKKINKSPKFKVQSGGLFPGVPVTEDIIKAGKNLGVEISKTQQGLPHSLLMWSDYIILVADDVPKSIFKEVQKNDGKKVFHWRLKDIQGTDVKKREKIMIKIKEKIKDFLKKHTK